jgi:hypothetical protein
VQLKKKSAAGGAGEVRSKEVKRKKAKRKPSAQSAAIEAHPAPAPAIAVPAEGKQLSADAASVMKKLTRVLRAVKSLQGRIESGEVSKSACMIELTDLHIQLTAAQSETGATDPACVSALRKLSNQLGKVALAAKSIKSDPVVASSSPPPPPAIAVSSAVPAGPSGKGPPPAAPVVKKKLIRRSVGTGKELPRVDAEMKRFEELLVSVHLEQFLQELRDLGVERVSDLQYVSEDDLAPTTLKPIQKKKLLSLYSEHEAVPLNKSLEALVSPKDTTTTTSQRQSRGSRKVPRDPASPRSEDSASPSTPSSGRRASHTPALAVKGEEAATSTPLRRSIKSGPKLESTAHMRRGSVDTPLLSPSSRERARSSAGQGPTPGPPSSSPPTPSVAAPSEVDPKKAIKKIIPKRSSSTSSIPARK